MSSFIKTHPPVGSDDTCITYHVFMGLLLCPILFKPKDITDPPQEFVK